MTASNMTQSQPSAVEVLFAGQASAEIIKIRQAWTYLMACNRVEEAKAIVDAVYSSDDDDRGISAALFEIAKIERCRKIVSPAVQAGFEAHVNTCARTFYPSSVKASRIFFDTAMAIGFGGNDPIGRGRAAADAWLNPPKVAGLGSKTEQTRGKASTRRGNQVRRINEDRALVDKGRTGTGARG